MSAAVGKRLRQAREEQGLSLEQVAAETHIRLHYLEAMEAGQFDSIPSRVQARGFLRYYAGHLKIAVEPLFDALEGDALLTLVQAEEQPAPHIESTQDEDKTALAPIGETLKAQRETLGLSLEDVARHTHLRVHYLQALERGNMDALPSSVQGGGMLKNYAEFLSLDPEPLLLRFADELQARLRERQQPQARRTRTRKQPQQNPSAIRRIFSRDILVSGFLVVFLIVFSIWAGTRISSARTNEEMQPTPPSIADVLLPSATVSEVSTATATIPSPVDEAANAAADAGSVADVSEAEISEADITQEALDLAFAENAVRLQIVIRQRSYMRIIVDGEVEFDGRVVPGAAYAFAGEESVEILTGNSAALYVTFNDLELGLLGTFGEVRDIVFTIDGLLTPTPTISPTPTNTPRRTPTFTPTSTLNP
jgi:cytoskeleton protein RodZ